jgi:hypothetical protein
MARLGRGLAVAAGAGAVSSVTALLAGCPIDIQADLGRDLPALEASTPLPDASGDAGSFQAAAGDVDAGSFDAQVLAPLVACQSAAVDPGDAEPAAACPQNVNTDPFNGIFGDGGIISSTVAVLPGALVAGQTYQYTYQRSPPLDVGNPVKVDVFGSNAPDTCKPQQKLFTLNLDGVTQEQSYCFTANASYGYAVNEISAQGAIVYGALVVGRLCPGCDLDQ